MSSNEAHETEISFDELQRLYDLNLRLLDNLRTTITWILQYADRTSVSIPNIDALRRLMREACSLANELESPVIPQHHFIKPLERGAESKSRSPRDKLTPYPEGGFRALPI